MLSSLWQSREQRRCFIKCVMSPRGFVLTGLFYQFLAACVSQRHCCCSSWRWREGEVRGVCCCPGLFGYGALGRGHWPTAAHPLGPPCGKPGNVEWRPIKRRMGKEKMTDWLSLDPHLCLFSVDNISAPSIKWNSPTKISHWFKVVINLFMFNILFEQELHHTQY